MIDLLSPVGNFDCLKAAVQNGANSVYFGADLFNARAYASNFNLDDLEKAIIYAKARGVKTNLTLNTLVTDNEFNDAFELAKKAYEYGIDAIIVQDLGLAKQLIKHFPDLDIHASTQMTVHNLQGVLKMQELGFVVEMLPLKKNGQVDVAQIKSLLKEDTILVSVCSVDSELGIRQPIEEIGKVLKDYKYCFFHSDASQAIGKVAIDYQNVDLVTVAPHKFYGMLGTGILIKKKNVGLNTN